VAKHRRGVHVGGLDRRTGEADEGGIGQRIAQVLGKAVGDLAGLAGHLGLEAVLAAVRLVGDDHDVGTIGQRALLPSPSGRGVGGEGSRREFLNRRKNHPTRGAIQQAAQMLAVLRLHRRLPEQVAALREGRKQLVVQIIAVSQHHQRGIGHARVEYQQARVEGHQQAFAGALGVPDHPGFAISGRLALDARQPVDGGIVPHPRPLSRGERGERRAQCRDHRLLHRMELVVASNDLDQPATGFTEYREMA